MAQVSDNEDADIPLRPSRWEGGVDVEEFEGLVSLEQEQLIATMRDRV